MLLLTHVVVCAVGWDVDPVAVLAFLRETSAEIVCILEGSEPLSGCSMQARFSYTAADILVNHNFAPCVFRAPNGVCHVDFDRFHDVVPIAVDLAVPIQSIS